MGLLTDFAKRASLENPNVSIKQALTGGFSSSAGENVTPSKSMTHMGVFNAVTLISGAVSTLPLKIYRRREDRGKDEARDHVLWNLLRTDPNPEIDAHSLRETLQAHLLLWGNAYAQIVRNNAGRLMELWPIGPWRVKPERHQGDIRYRVNLSGIDSQINQRPDRNQERFISRSDMFHIPGLSFNGRVGLSPIAYAREMLGQGISMKEYGARFFSNDSMPGGFLSHPESLSSEARRNLRSEFEDMHRGKQNAWKVALLEEGVEWQRAGIPPEDSQFLESQKFNNTEVARLFNLPPHKIADLERSTFNNIEEQNIEYLQDTLTPWLTRWEVKIKKQLIPREEWGEIEAEHVVEGLLRGDSESRAEFYTAAINNGWMSPNEVREKENRNPIEGGDQHFIPLNMMSLTSDAVNVEEGGEENPDERSHDHDHRGEMGPAEYRYDSEIRSAEGRRRTIFQMRDPFERVFQQILDREASDLRDIINETDETRDIEDFVDEINEYYSEEFPEFVESNAFPAFQLLSDQIAQQAADEIGEDVPQDDVNEFLDGYTSTYVRRRSASSRKQLEEVIEETDGDPFEAVEQRVEDWEEDRPEREAKQETNRLGNAVAMTTFKAGGVSQKRWMSFSPSCPYCDALNGQVVGIDEVFLEAGQDFNPTGATGGLNPRSSKLHPPAHAGGDCLIVPA